MRFIQRNKKASVLLSGRLLALGKNSDYQEGGF